MARASSLSHKDGAALPPEIVRVIEAMARDMARADHAAELAVAGRAGDDLRPLAPDGRSVAH
jgi:hypothetical protein